jgi:hypothetical protein
MKTKFRKISAHKADEVKTLIYTTRNLICKGHNIVRIVKYRAFLCAGEIGYVVRNKKYIENFTGKAAY